MNFPLPSDRCTGRTFRQLKALPDGSIYIVRNNTEKRHCHHLLHNMGRFHKAITIICTDDWSAPHLLRGLPRSTLWDIDHDAVLPTDGHWWELLTRYRYAPYALEKKGMKRENLSRIDGLFFALSGLSISSAWPEKERSVTLFDRIKETRRELLRQGAHIEALHLGSRAANNLIAEIPGITGTPELVLPFEKFMGIPLETPLERGQPTVDYCAFRWKREARSPAILFEVIQP